jgi:hypothetical protein
MCLFLYLFVYICNVVGDPIIKRGGFGLINRIVSAIFVCTSQAMIFN